MGKSKDLATGASYQDQTESDARYANVSGDTFTGTVTVTGSTNTNTTLNVVTPNWVSGAYADFNLGYQPISRKIRGSWIDGIEVYTNNANAALRVDASGRVTMPYQPHFLANNYGQAKAVSWQKLDFTTAVDINVGGHYSTSTSSFTAPIAGVYFFSVGGYISANNSTERYAFDLRVNGSGGTYIGGGTQAAIDAPLSSFTRTISLNANDYVDVWMYTPNAETLGASYHRMWFNGYLLG